MSDKYEKIRKLVECEIEKIAEKNELSAASLESLDKMVDIIKDLDEVEEREEYGYSQRSYGRRMMMADNGMSNSNGYGYGYIYDMPEFDRGYNRRNSYRNMRGGYSREGGKDYMIEHLENAMDEATTEEERKLIRQCIAKLEK